MYASEDVFVHLRRAADERQRRELEYLRIARERAADTASAAAPGPRELVRRFFRSESRPPRRLAQPG